MPEEFNPCAHLFARYSRVSLQVLSVLILNCSGVEQKHQSLFHLMELPLFSAEVESHVEAFFKGVLKGRR